MADKNNNVAGKVVLGFGAVIGLWAISALVSGISQVGSVSELVRQYMVATGMVTPLHTLVDYYTHIKGIEYLICVAFFVAFPVFFTYVNKEKKEAKVKA
ncbi:MAG: hypothetical protein U9P36_05590 [Thermodesulfobacteriota bacterium]|nr:hypothetical protein [Thermodesulfobacteriota bacterium]